MLRSYRICGMAAIDLLLTLIAAAFIGNWLSIPLLLSFLILFFIGQLFHIAFGVETAFLKKINSILF